jgi:hypothetical protein
MSGVSLVNDGAALQSMRDSDFDAYSAIGEVIDNALQAEAKNVRIRVDFNTPQNKKGTEPITAIYFGDDGLGMPKDVLHRCLQLGYSSRYNDRTGIGRFGVGATLAAINQCRKVELYSCEKGGQWQYTYIDLDLITHRPPLMEEIPEPIPKDVPAGAADLVSTNHGTLVVWTKYDRQHEGALDLIEELRVWVGRTYRHFIWGNAKISINQEPVKAIDPLYVTTRLTRYPDDPAAHEYKTIEIPWPVASEDRVKGAPAESPIRIRLSLLPKELRLAQGAGNLKATKDRFIDRNEGISIVRNKREVFYGHIPYWPGSPFEEIDRWWGCEISFDAVLDSSFTVKNIKRGALPVKPLKVTINNAISPTRKSSLEKVRDRWAETRANEAKVDIENGVDTGHSDAERAAKETPTPTSSIDKDKNLDDEIRKVTNEF